MLRGKRIKHQQMGAWIGGLFELPADMRETQSGHAVIFERFRCGKACFPANGIEGKLFI